jgi:hypothetical protein
VRAHIHIVEMFFNASDSYPAMFSTTPQPLTTTIPEHMFTAFVLVTCITQKKTQRTAGHPRSEGVNLSHFQREKMPRSLWGDPRGGLQGRVGDGSDGRDGGDGGGVMVIVVMTP